MIRLTHHTLQRASTDGLSRLAAFLGVSPVGPFPTEADARHRLIAAIAREEKRLSRAPRDKRYPTAALGSTE